MSIRLVYIIIILALSSFQTVKAELTIDVTGNFDFGFLLFQKSNICIGTNFEQAGQVFDKLQDYEKELKAINENKYNTQAIAKQQLIELDNKYPKHDVCLSLFLKGETEKNDEFPEKDKRENEEEGVRIGSILRPEFTTTKAEIILLANNIIADNDFSYGMTIKLDLNNTLSSTAYIDYKGSFGQLEIGLIEGAEDRLSVENYNDAGIGFVHDNMTFDRYSLARKKQLAILTYKNFDFDGNSGKNPKISYYSPELKGFTLGVSYGVNQAESDIQSSKFNNFLGFGLKYQAVIKDNIYFQTGIGYGIEVPNKINKNLPLKMGLSYGLGFNYLGFNIGSSLAVSFNRYSSSRQKCEYINGYLKPEEKCLNEYSIQSNIGYKADKYSVGIGFMMSFLPNVETIDATAQGYTDLEMTAKVGLGADYYMFPGFRLFLDIVYSIERPAIFNKSDYLAQLANTSSTSFTFGTGVSF